MLLWSPIPHDGAQGFAPLRSGSRLNWGSGFLLAASRELIGLFGDKI